MSRKSIIVTGAAGRIGRVLHILWGSHLAGHDVIWSARKPGPGVDLVWNIGAGPDPALPPGAVILHLAGQTRGGAQELAENRRSVAALCAAARFSGAGHVFVMSSVAVYHPGPSLIDESRLPQPASPYGAAKLDAEIAAQQALPPGGLTVLRLGNLAGADALLTAARTGPVVLDPIERQAGGPLRSYIGPQALAKALEVLIRAALQASPLPDILNLGQAPPLAMADLLAAYGADWRYGPPRAAAIAALAVDVARLSALVDLPPATAQSVVDDLTSLQGSWP